MISFPNAKINLGLNILSKRQDGYHNISSCFYPIGWSDILEIIPSEKFTFSSIGLDIPGSSTENLCVLAYQILKENHDIPPVHIHLHKIIPIGAGLGGGSSDGTFTLKLLNDLFSLNLSLEILMNYANQLGSDCSFFIENSAKLVFGKGDEFSRVNLDLTGKTILLIYPDKHISTQEAYSQIIPSSVGFEIKDILELPISEWKSSLYNDFEKSIEKNYPEVQALKSTIYEHGALYASMTGSGSTVYGVFDNPISATLLDSLPNSYSIWSGDL